MSVVGAIEPGLRKAEIERARRKRPDSHAYNLYLRALPFASAAMPEDADKALPFETHENWLDGPRYLNMDHLADDKIEFG